MRAAVENAEAMAYASLPVTDHASPRLDEEGVRGEHDGDGRDDRRPVGSMRRAAARGTRPLFDERSADVPKDDRRDDELRGDPGSISASWRWRIGRCRRSVGQPTRGQRWRAREAAPPRPTTAAVVALEERDQRGRQRAGVDVRHENAGPFMLHDVRQPAGIERDDRRFAQLRFDRNEARALRRPTARRAPSPPDKIRRAGWGEAVPLHAIGDAEPVRQLFERLAILSVTDDVELNGSGMRLIAWSKISMPFCLLSRPTNNNRSICALAGG